MRTSKKAVLFALLLVAVVARAQPARECANCGLGRGNIVCGCDEMGIRAAKSPKATVYASPKTIAEAAKIRKDQQSQASATSPIGLLGAISYGPPVVSAGFPVGSGAFPAGTTGFSEGYGVAGAPGIIVPSGSGTGMLVAPSTGGYGPSGLSNVILRHPGSGGQTTCRASSSPVITVEAQPLAVAAVAAANAAQEVANAAAFNRVREQQELDQLLNLQPGATIAPKFSPVSEVCLLPGFGPGSSAPGFPGGPSGEIPPNIQVIGPDGQVHSASGSPGSPPLVVAGVKPAIPGKAPCACGSGGDRVVGQSSAFEQAVAEATAKALAERDAVERAAKQAAASGLVAQIMSSGCGGPGGAGGSTAYGPGGSNAPGFKPLSQDFAPPSPFATPEESQGLSFPEQENLINGMGPQAQPNAPADSVTVEIAYKKLQELHSPSNAPSAYNSVPVPEDKLGFGHRAAPSDGRSTRQIPDLPDQEKLCGCDKPIFELKLPSTMSGQGPTEILGPHSPRPRKLQPLEEAVAELQALEDENIIRESLVPGGKPTNYLSFGDLGFGPVEPNCNNIESVKVINENSIPATFDSPTVVVVGSGVPGAPGAPGVPGAPGTTGPGGVPVVGSVPIRDTVNDDDLPCGPIGPPAPGYQPGAVIVKRPEFPSEGSDGGSGVGPAGNGLGSVADFVYGPYGNDNRDDEIYEDGLSSEEDSDCYCPNKRSLTARTKANMKKSGCSS